MRDGRQRVMRYRRDKIIGTEQSYFLKIRIFGAL